MQPETKAPEAPKEPAAPVVYQLPQEAQATVKNLSLLLIGMREGLGLSTACQMSGNDVQHVSGLAKQYPDFLQQLEGWTNDGRTEYLQAANDFLRNNNLEKMAQARQGALNMPAVNLWEGYCSAEDVTPQKLLLVFLDTRNARETATLIGMSYAEFTAYVTQRQAITQTALELTGRPIL
jgi:hypothetical protein